MSQTTDTQVGGAIVVPREYEELAAIKRALPAFQGVNTDFFRNSLIKDEGFLDKITEQVYQTNLNDGVLDLSGVQKEEEKQKRLADYRFKIKDDLRRIAVGAAMDGPTFTNAVTKKKTELGVYDKLNPVQAGNYLDVIKNNPTKYGEFFNPDGTMSIGNDDQSMMTLTSRISTDAGFRQRLEEDNVARFYGELARKHNVGAGVFDSKQLAEAYAIYDATGAEGLTDFVNLYTKEQKGAEGKVIPMEARPEFYRLQRTSVLPYAKKISEIDYAESPSPDLQLNIDHRFNAFNAPFYKKIENNIVRGGLENNRAAFESLFTSVGADKEDFEEAYAAFTLGAKNDAYNRFLTKAYNASMDPNSSFSFQNVLDTLMDPNHNRQYKYDARGWEAKYLTAGFGEGYGTTPMNAFELDTTDPVVRMAREIARLDPGYSSALRHDTKQVFVPDIQAMAEARKDSRPVRKYISDIIKSEQYVWSDEAGGLVLDKAVSENPVTWLLDGSSQLYDGAVSGFYDSFAPLIRAAYMHGGRLAGYSDADLEAIYNGVRDSTTSQFVGEDRTNFGAAAGLAGYMGGFVGGIYATGGYGTWPAITKLAQARGVATAMNAAHKANMFQKWGKLASMVPESKTAESVRQLINAYADYSKGLGGMFVLGTAPHAGLSAKYDPAQSLFNNPLLDTVLGYDEDRPIGSIEEFYKGSSLATRVAMDMGADVFLGLLFDTSLALGTGKGLKGSDTAKLTKLFGNDGLALLEQAVVGKGTRMPFPEMVDKYKPLVLRELESQLANAPVAQKAARDIVDQFNVMMGDDLPGFLSGLVRTFDDQLIQNRGKNLRPEDIAEIRASEAVRVQELKASFYDNIAGHIYAETNTVPTLTASIADAFYEYAPSAKAIQSGLSYREATKLAGVNPGMVSVRAADGTYTLFSVGKPEFAERVADGIRSRMFGITRSQAFDESGKAVNPVDLFPNAKNPQQARDTFENVHNSFFGMEFESAGNKYRFIGFLPDGKVRAYDFATKKIVEVEGTKIVIPQNPPKSTVPIPASRQLPAIGMSSATSGRMAQVRIETLRSEINDLELSKARFKNEAMSPEEKVALAYPNYSDKAKDALIKGLKTVDEKVRKRTEKRITDALARRQAEIDAKITKRQDEIGELDGTKYKKYYEDKVKADQDAETARLESERQVEAERQGSLRKQLGEQLVRFGEIKEQIRLKGLAMVQARRGQGTWETMMSGLKSAASKTAAQTGLDVSKTAADILEREIYALRQEAETLTADLRTAYLAGGDIKPFTDDLVYNPDARYGLLAYIEAAATGPVEKGNAIDMSTVVNKVISVMPYLDNTQRAAVIDKMEEVLDVSVQRQRIQELVAEETKLMTDKTPDKKKLIEIRKEIAAFDDIIKKRTSLLRTVRNADTKMPDDPLSMLDMVVDSYDARGFADESWRAVAYADVDEKQTKVLINEAKLRAALINQEIAIINRKRNYTVKGTFWSRMMKRANVSKPVVALNAGLENMGMIHMTTPGGKRVFIKNAPDVPLSLYDGKKSVPSGVAVLELEPDGHVGVYVARQFVPENGMRPSQFITDDMGVTRFNPYWQRLGVNVMRNEDGTHKTYRIEMNGQDEVHVEVASDASGGTGLQTMHVNVQRPAVYDPAVHGEFEQFVDKVKSQNLGDAVVYEDNGATHVMLMSVDQQFDSKNVAVKKTPIEDFAETEQPKVELNGLDTSKLGPVGTAVLLGAAGTAVISQQNSDTQNADLGMLTLALAGMGLGWKSMQFIGKKSKAFFNTKSNVVYENIRKIAKQQAQHPAANTVRASGGTRPLTPKEAQAQKVAVDASNTSTKPVLSHRLGHLATTYMGNLHKLGVPTAPRIMALVESIENMPYMIRSRYIGHFKNTVGGDPDKWARQNAPALVAQIMDSMPGFRDRLAALYAQDTMSPMDPWLASMRAFQFGTPEMLGMQTEGLKGMETLFGQFVSWKLQTEGNVAVARMVKDNPLMQELFKAMDEYTTTGVNGNQVRPFAEYATSMQQMFSPIVQEFRRLYYKNIGERLALLKTDVRTHTLLSQFVSQDSLYGITDPKTGNPGWKSTLTKEDRDYLEKMRRDSKIGGLVREVIDMKNTVTKVGMGIGNYLPGIIDHNKLDVIHAQLMREFLAGDLKMTTVDAENRAWAKIVDHFMSVNGYDPKKSGRRGYLEMYDTESGEIAKVVFTGSERGGPDSYKNAKEHALRFLIKIKEQLTPDEQLAYKDFVTSSAKSEEDLFLNVEQIYRTDAKGENYKTWEFSIRDEHGYLNRIADKMAVDNMLRDAKRAGLRVKQSNHLEMIRKYEIPAELQLTDMPMLIDIYTKDVGARMGGLEHGVYDISDFDTKFLAAMDSEMETRGFSSGDISYAKNQAQDLFLMANNQDPKMIGMTEDARIAYLEKKDSAAKIINILKRVSTAPMYPFSFPALDSFAALVTMPFFYGNHVLREVLLKNGDIAGMSLRDYGRHLAEITGLVSDSIASITPTLDDNLVHGQDYLSKMNRGANRLANAAAGASLVRVAEGALDMMGMNGVTLERLKKYPVPILNSFMEINKANTGLYVAGIVADVLDLGMGFKKLKASGGDSVLHGGREMNVGFIRRQLELHGIKLDTMEQLDRFFADQDTYLNVTSRARKHVPSGRVDVTNLDQSKLASDLKLTAEELEGFRRGRDAHMNLAVAAKNNFHATSMMNKVPASLGTIGQMVYQFTQYPINVGLQGIQRRIRYPLQNFRQQYDKLGDYNVLELFTMVTNRDINKITKTLAAAGMPSDAAAVKQFMMDFPVEAIYQGLRIPQYIVGTSAMFMGRDAMEDIMTLPFVDDKDEWLNMKRNMIVNRFADKEDQFTFGEMFDKPALDVVANIIPRLWYETGRSAVLGMYPSLAESMNYIENPFEMIPLTRVVGDIYTAFGKKGIRNLLYSPQDLGEFPEAAASTALQYQPFMILKPMRSGADDFIKYVSSATESREL